MSTITGRKVLPEYEAYLRDHDLSDVVSLRPAREQRHGGKTG